MSRVGREDTHCVTSLGCRIYTHELMDRTDRRAPGVGAGQMVGCESRPLDPIRLHWDETPQSCLKPHGTQTEGRPPEPPAVTGCHGTATGRRGLQPGPPRVGCGLGQKRVLAGTRSERHPSGDSVPGPRPGPEDVGYDAGRNSLYQTYSFFHRFEIISKRRVNRKKKRGKVVLKNHV